MTNANDQHNPIALPAEIADAVQRELQPGESVTWWGQAKTGEALRFLCTSGLWFPLLIMVLCGIPLFSVGTEGMSAADKSALLTLMIPSLLAWVIWLGAILWGWREVRSTFYVVTDRRVFTLRVWPWRRLTGTLPGSPLRVSGMARRHGTANVRITAWRDGNSGRMITVAFMMVGDMAGLEAALAAMPGVPHDTGAGGKLFSAVAAAAKPHVWRSVFVLCVALLWMAKRVHDNSLLEALRDWTVIGLLAVGIIGTLVNVERLLRWRRVFASAPAAADDNAAGEQTHDP
jgi:hypothetical protein